VLLDVWSFSYFWVAAGQEMALLSDLTCERLTFMGVSHLGWSVKRSAINWQVRLQAGDGRRGWDEMISRKACDQLTSARTDWRRAKRMGWDGQTPALQSIIVDVRFRQELHVCSGTLKHYYPSQEAPEPGRFYPPKRSVSHIADCNHPH